MLRAIVSTGIRQADFLLQSRLCLTQPLFVEDPAAASSAGPYTAADWSRIRQKQTAPFGPDQYRYDSDDTYRQYLAHVHEDKILSVQLLMKHFDFGRYRRILELGCGDMPQAHAICSRFPAILYTATDFDPAVIENCGRLPMLSGIRKLVLDAARDDLDELGNNDLVISWSLEFSLEDQHLTRLFAACRRHSVPYLLCTHTAVGPLAYLRRSWMQWCQQSNPQGLRLLGRLRSVGEIARLARQAGMMLQSRAYYVNHAVMLFTPR